MKKIFQSVKNGAIMAKEALRGAFQQIREHGLPTGLKLGLSNLDNLFRLDKGMVAIITGIPNMGKSEFIDFIVVQLNKLYGMKILFFSPENQPIGLHIAKLFRKLTGLLPNNLIVKSECFNKVSEYIYDNFFFFNYENMYSIDEILGVAEEMVREKGIEVMVIDSYNKMASDITAFETQLIGQVMDKIVQFAKRTGVLVLLVVHPKKMDKNNNGTYKMPTGYDANGSANFLNKTDYSIIVHRNYEPNYAIIGCDKVKFSNYGGIGKTALGFDNLTTNYYDIDDTDLDTLHGIENVAPAPDFIPFEIPEPQPIEGKIMTGRDYLNITVSAFADKTNKTPNPVNLYVFLTSGKYADKVKYIRDGATSEEIKERKNKVSLPSITVSAILEGGRSEDNVVSHTNLMCIDIDKKDNPDIIEKIPEILKSLPYVAFFQKSVSGQGYYAIIPIENGDTHLQHFLALEEEFAGMGITIDKSCKNVARLRFYSYDEDRYIAEDNVRIYSKLKEPVKQLSRTKPTQRLLTTSSTMQNTPNQELMDELDQSCKKVSDSKIVVCPDYESWFQVGCALANELGESGRQYYQLLSEPHSGYDKEETDYKYDECLESHGKYNYSKGTLFHYINQAISE